MIVKVVFVTRHLAESIILYAIDRLDISLLSSV